MASVLTDNKAKENISANVERLMAEQGMNQAELARRTEESTARISLMIRGIKLPSAAFLARIAEALSVSTDELLAEPPRAVAKKSKQTA